MQVRRKGTAAAVIVGAAMITLALVPGCGGVPDTTVVQGEIGSSIDEYLTAIVPYGFSGAALVVSEGEVVLKKGYGLADDGEGIPNTAETVFSVGSITKQFTAAAVLKLESAGVLSTSDPISVHIEGVPSDKAGVTLHHLLTHTAGVVGNTGDDFEEVGRDELVRRVLAAPLAFEPGTRMSYSNAGYSLLAAIVELRSGRPYEEYLREALFEPAGMRETGYRLPDWDESRVARWYDGETDNGTLLEKAYPRWNLLGNGGIQSTLGDMYLWHEALKGVDVLSEEEKAKLWTPYLNDYAYGWDVLETPGGKLIQHDGGSSLGASAEFRWFVDKGLLLVLFCNRSYDGEPLFEMVRSELRELAFGDEVVVPPPTIDVTDELLDEYAGNYRLRTGGGILVDRSRAGLTLKTFDQDVINALFLPGSEPHALEDLNERSVRLMAAAASGSSEGFVAELGEGDFARRVEALLVQRLRRFAETTGSPARAAVSLGSVPFAEDGTVMTGVRIRNAEGDHDDLSLWWRADELVGLDDRAFEISIPLAAFSESQFIGYHLGFARVHSLEFERGDDGAVTAMRIGAHTAARLGGTAHGQSGETGHEGHDH